MGGDLAPDRIIEMLASLELVPGCFDTELGALGAGIAASSRSPHIGHGQKRYVYVDV